jgi:hypothetical protein
MTAALGLLPNDPITNLRRLAGAGAEIAAEIQRQVVEARRRSRSWDEIAGALAHRGRALGELFPSAARRARGRRLVQNLSSGRRRRAGNPHG